MHLYLREGEQTRVPSLCAQLLPRWMGDCGCGCCCYCFFVFVLFCVCLIINITLMWTDAKIKHWKNITQLLLFLIVINWLLLLQVEFLHLVPSHFLQSVKGSLFQGISTDNWPKYCTEWNSQGHTFSARVFQRKYKCTTLKLMKRNIWIIHIFIKKKEINI